LPLRLTIQLLLSFFDSTYLRGMLSVLSGTHTNQLWRERSIQFEKIVAIEVSKSGASVLEIGSWFGTGSTRVFLKHLADNGHFYSVDSWSAKRSTGLSSHHSAATRGLAAQTKSAWISSSSRLYGAQRNLPNATLIQIRCASIDLHALLNQKKKFDLIYIDGSHIYEDVRMDLEFAIQHIGPGGLICGDDLDLGLEARYLELALEHLEKDLVVLPDGSAFHPGVLKAVSEKFKQVDSHNGFWWIRM